jgi:hypothetical protein
VTSDHPFSADNAAATARLRALVARLSDSDLVRPVGGGWTVTTVLGHLAFWDRRVAAIVERWTRDGAASDSPVDDDPINEALGPIWTALLPREAARLAVEAAEAADARLAALPPALADAALAGSSPINPRRSAHRNEHIEQIERALR